VAAIPRKAARSQPPRATAAPALALTDATPAAAPGSPSVPRTPAAEPFEFLKVLNAAMAATAGEHTSVPVAGVGPIDITVLSQRRGPFLVVAPLSTLGHWIREVDAWTAGSGIATRRASLVAQLTRCGSANMVGPRHSFEATAATLPCNALLYHGPAPARAQLRETEFYFTDPRTGVALRPPLHSPPGYVTASSPKFG
jgi:hypothetical protein